jgi:hypothetical protein
MVIIEPGRNLLGLPYGYPLKLWADLGQPLLLCCFLQRGVILGDILLEEVDTVEEALSVKV